MPRGIRSLCRPTPGHGSCQKAHGQYALTKVSTRPRPSLAGLWRGHQLPRCPYSTSAYMADPAAFVRNGGSPASSIVSAHNPVWVTFARAITDSVAATAAAVAATSCPNGTRPSARHSLAGHGLFGVSPLAERGCWCRDHRCSIGQRSSGRPGSNVAKVGATCARYQTLPGYGSSSGRRLRPHPATEFLYDFDTHTNIGSSSVGRVRTLGGVIVIEFVPNLIRSGPPFPTPTPLSPNVVTTCGWWRKCLPRPST